MSNIAVLASNSRFCAQRFIEELERRGYKVVFCENATEVLEQFAKPQEEIPVLLVTNQHLGHEHEFTSAETRYCTRTGVVLCKRLRSQFPNLFVVIFTMDTKIHDEILALGDRKVTSFYIFDDNWADKIPTLQSLAVQPA